MQYQYGDTGLGFPGRSKTRGLVLRSWADFVRALRDLLRPQANIVYPDRSRFRNVAQRKPVADNAVSRELAQPASDCI
jgi:hypothetical protein